MKCCILTDGGPGIGWGHLTRCSSIAQALSTLNVECEFMVFGAGAKRVVPSFPVHSVDWVTRFERVWRKARCADIVILDSYRTPSLLVERITEEATLPVFFDDFGTAKPARGFVINGAIDAARANRGIRGKEHLRFLLGTDYTPLRKDFWRVPRKRIRTSLRTVMVLMGGTDVGQMTSRLLRMMNERFSGVKKLVVLGSRSSLQEVKSLLKAGDQLLLNASAKELKEAMLGSDAAISAGGQTLYELARVGLPTVSVLVAENQKHNVKGWSNAGFAKSAGSWNNSRVIGQVARALAALSDKSERERMSAAGRSRIDGMGSLRIARSLIDALENARREVRTNGR